MIDMEKILRNHRVPYTGPNRRGWLSMTCPRCGKRYLGWNIDSHVFFCWQCRGLPLLLTLGALLNMPPALVRGEIEKYKTGTRRKYRATENETSRPSILKWPAGIGPVLSPHKKYLQRRGLDPDEIESLWKIRGTTSIAEPQFANRIFAPLIFNYEEVSWQGRSISKSNALRYITCADENEIIPSKSLVYGWDCVQHGKAVVVEGLFDVWKGGPGCVHTFGISWTSAQLNLLSRLRSAVIAYDDEDDARRSGEQLAESLDGLGVKCALLFLDKKDFGAMPVDEARTIVRQALKAVR